MRHVEKSLEKLIDEYTMKGVIEGIIEICFLKAQYLRENGLEDFARIWDEHAKLIDKTSNEITV